MMEKAMEQLNVQLNRLTRSLRRARTVELPEGKAGSFLFPYHIGQARWWFMLLFQFPQNWSKWQSHGFWLDHLSKAYTQYLNALFKYEMDTRQRGL